MSHIFIEAETLPEGWERAVVACWDQGDAIATEYDQEGNPPSKDCTAMIAVRDPIKEPRIHRAFPGGLEDLEAYRQEVALGIHDHWIDPDAGKWSYTYHQRMFDYDVHDAQGNEQRIDQFAYIIDKLAEAPHSRRAQAITWKVDVDPIVEDPACLQRMWFRVFGNELRLNVHMRSNDAFKASFMNMWAFTDLQRYVAEELGKKRGQEMRIGPYTHIVDSFHIYGSYFDEFEGFLDTLKKRTFEQRVWDSTDDFVQETFEETKRKIENETGPGDMCRTAGL